MSEKRIQVRSSQVAMTILKAVGTVGVVVAVVALPGLGLVVRDLQRFKDKKDRQRLYQSLQYLGRRGYVKLEYLKDGKIKISLTKQGTTVVKKLDIEQMEILNSDRWDQKWRVVIFDVPNWKSKNRLAFTERLKHLGFRMIQKSVWGYPFPCHDEIMILRKFYDIEKYVTYLETAMVEDEYLWRQRFSHFHLG